MANFANGGAIKRSGSKSIFGNIQAIGFRTEFNTGSDDSRFDSAVFNGFVDHNATVSGGVPEPGDLALVLVGLSTVGDSGGGELITIPAAG
jgi:hypothetical protein